MVVQGLLALAMVQGLLAGLAYWVFGVPLPVWTAIMGFFVPSPIGGSALVSVPVSIDSSRQGETLRGIGVTLHRSLGVVGMVDNILKLLLIGNRLGLPVVLFFLGILGGLALFGAVGTTLGLAPSALLWALAYGYAEETAKPGSARKAIKGYGTVNILNILGGFINNGNKIGRNHG